MRSTVGGVIWLVVGVVLASTHHYLSNVNAFRPFISAILAVFLWPLLLLGINLHVR